MGWILVKMILWNMKRRKIQNKTQMIRSQAPKERRLIE